MTRWILTLVAIMAVSTITHAAPIPSQVYRWDDLAVEQKETGQRRPILEGSTTHLDWFAVHASTVQPNVALHASHTHTDTEELVIVKEGTLRVSINEKQRVMGPGSVAYFLPGDEHGLSNAGDTPVPHNIRNAGQVPCEYFAFKWR